MGSENVKVKCPLPQSSITEQFSPSNEQVCQSVNKIRKRYKFQKLFVEDPETHLYKITLISSVNKYAFLAKSIKISYLQNPSAINSTDNFMATTQNLDL